MSYTDSTGQRRSLRIKERREAQPPGLLEELQIRLAAYFYRTPLEMLLEFYIPRILFLGLVLTFLPAHHGTVSVYTVFHFAVQFAFFFHLVRVVRMSLLIVAAAA
jgi:hypothetical protein